MVEIKKMSVKRRKALVDRINKVMKDEFGIEQESINGFWETFMAGAEKNTSGMKGKETWLKTKKN